MPVFHTKTIESILDPVAQQVRFRYVSNILVFFNLFENLICFFNKCLL